MKNLTIFLALLLIICFVSVDVSYGQVAGQVPLKPAAIPQFVDPLPHFAGIRVDAKTATNVYVEAVPHKQVAVSTGTKLATGTVGVTPGIGMANLWVYRISTDNVKWTPPLWPAFTIETTRGNPLHVHYSSALGGETYAKVGLVVDQTLHWANPNKLPMGDAARLLPFGSEPPITVHLHGGEVSPLSDGGPDSWFTSGGLTGHSFNPDPYIYPNTQEAATLWFHDHALGATRLNVYAGMAGFYFLRDGATEDALHLPGWSGDDLVQEAAGGFASAAYLPELEVVIQDRMFDTNGGLYFPVQPTNPLIHPFWTPEFIGDVITVNGKTWPYLSVAPRKYRIRLLNGSNARFYNLSFPKGGPTITQIGTDGGFLDNPVLLGNGPLLIAPGERADIIIDFSAFSPLKKNLKSKVESFILTNNARTPFPGGGVVQGNTTGKIMQFVVNGAMVDNASSPLTDGIGGDRSGIPQAIKTNVKLTDIAGNPTAGLTIAKARQLTLNEVMAAGGPLEALVNNTKWEGTARSGFFPLPNGDGTSTYYSETVDEGTTEIWKIINLTGDAHPIHLHLVQLQLMSRQPFNVAGYTAAYDASFTGGGTDPMTGLPYPAGVYIPDLGPPLDYTLNQTLGGPLPTIGGNPDVTPFLMGAALPANPNERGWKDTFIMYPGEVTSVIARWAPTDLPINAPMANLVFPFDPSEGFGYVWHCHIIDHEDNEMMRPYRVIPNGNPTRMFLTGSAASLKGASVEGAIADEKIAAQQPFNQMIEQINEVALEQNFPNPFSDETQIRFTLPESAHVHLTLINALGQVTTLIDAVAPAGLNTAFVEAGNLEGGVYFYQLRTGNVSLMKKMVVLK
jgi:FtsP/CotA-like multicopper oxidase with cupredoxin domain